MNSIITYPRGGLVRQFVRTLPKFVEVGTDIRIEAGNFIATAVNCLEFQSERCFTHVVMNPRKKMHDHRSLVTPLENRLPAIECG